MSEITATDLAVCEGQIKELMDTVEQHETTIKQQQEAITAWRAMLDNALDSKELDYDIQAVNWIHKDMANILDNLEKGE